MYFSVCDTPIRDEHAYRKLNEERTLLWDQLRPEKLEGDQLVSHVKRADDWSKAL
jgi:hypothetical protein